jgi:hypothetical protein
MPASEFRFNHGDNTITPLAYYSIKAVVLSRQRYRYDAAAEVAPIDLVHGWGPMSTAAVINALSISQSGRWYDTISHSKKYKLTALTANER